jgi:isopenicillin N synthase-like dioxygenase
MSTKSLPILDITPLLGLIPDLAQPGHYIDTTLPNNNTPENLATLQIALDDIVSQLYTACTNVGFFYIKTPYPELPQLISTMENYSHIFFNKSIDIKKRIDMTTVGSAWRGFFSVGDEYTSGAPDIKEGVYFGLELPQNDPRVISKVPMHGANVFPRTGGLKPDHVLEDGQHESYKWEEVEEDKVLKETILKYLEITQKIGFSIIDGLSLALQLPRYALRNILFTDIDELGGGGDQKKKEKENCQLSQLLPQDQYDPLCLFRIFNYPSTKQYQTQYDKSGFITPGAVSQNDSNDVTSSAITPSESTPTPKRTIYSVAEHTDYGCVTILYQDQSGGLEVRDIKSSDFIPAPPLPNTLVINIGDSLEKMTNGLFVSTPHRVLNQRDGDRISFPFFFDPSFKAQLRSLVPISPRLQEVFGGSGEGDGEGDNDQSSLKSQVFVHNQSYQRWDGKEIGLGGFSGTYGNYILEKVSKVFPQLAQQVELDPNKSQ